VFGGLHDSDCCRGQRHIALLRQGNRSVEIQVSLLGESGYEGFRHQEFRGKSVRFNLRRVFLVVAKLCRGACKSLAASMESPVAQLMRESKSSSARTDVVVADSDDAAVPPANEPGFGAVHSANAHLEAYISCNGYQGKVSGMGETV
jgi:hypothetical protein